MDELELLKKDWQKREEDLPKLSYSEIHTMLWKKSSSVVKWILIISILEFLLPHLLYFLPSMQSSTEIWKSLGLTPYLLGLSLVQYGVVVYFIVQFYKRFKEISVLDSTKSLMDKIIRTRKTVRRYIIFSLSVAFILFVFVAWGIYATDDLKAFMDTAIQGNYQGEVTEKLRWMLIVGTLVLGALVTLLAGGIYFLLYGFLLKKLKRNHRELKRLEI